MQAKTTTKGSLPLRKNATRSGAANNLIGVHNMRVVQLLPDMQLGGVERGVVELSRVLVKHTIDSVVISRTGALCTPLWQDGGKHVPFNCGGKNILTVPGRAWRLHKIIEYLRPDIVHIRSRVPAWLLHLAFGKRRKFSLVSTFHGIYSVGRYSGIMADADGIICPSRALVEYVKTHYDPPAEKLYLIHRGVDFSYFSPSDVDESFCTKLRTEHKLGGTKVIALVGRLSALKGHLFFLQAFARLQADFPVQAMLVGGGNPRRLHELQQLAASLGIAERVCFVGSQQRMREVYHLADVVVSASRKPEAFGRTVAEALAMNTPVVAPAYGGALDIVQDGKNGLLYAPNDEQALTAAMQKALATEWHGLRESVQHFSLAQMAEKTLHLYEQLASHRSA